MATPPKKRAGDFEPPRKHYCREHGEECKPTQWGTRRRIRFMCPKGCRLRRGATVLR